MLLLFRLRLVWTTSHAHASFVVQLPVQRPEQCYAFKTVHISRHWKALFICRVRNVVAEEQFVNSGPEPSPAYDRPGRNLNTLASAYVYRQKSLLIMWHQPRSPSDANRRSHRTVLHIHRRSLIVDSCISGRADSIVRVHFLPPVDGPHQTVSNSRTRCRSAYSAGSHFQRDDRWRTGDLVGTNRSDPATFVGHWWFTMKLPINTRGSPVRQ